MLGVCFISMSIRGGTTLLPFLVKENTLRGTLSGEIKVPNICLEASFPPGFTISLIMESRAGVWPVGLFLLSS